MATVAILFPHKEQIAPGLLPMTGKGFELLQYALRDADI